MGGYPGDQEKGLEMQKHMDRNTMTEDFGAGVTYLKADPGCSGKVGMVGFCFGGGVAVQLTIQMPGGLAAGSRRRSSEPSFKWRSVSLIASSEATSMPFSTPGLELTAPTMSTGL